MNKIVELLIDFEDLEFDDLGVEIMSLVESPAIQIGWMAFSKEEENEYQRLVLEMASDESFGEWYDPTEHVFIDTNQKEFASATEIVEAITAIDQLQDVAEDITGTVKYRYAGTLKANSRFFCRTMIGLNKLYTPIELAALGNAAATVSSSLYPGVSYVLEDGETVKGGVGEWLGGPRCGHYWQKVMSFPNGVNQVLGKADGFMGRTMDSLPNEGYQNFERQQFVFANDDQQIILGPAMIANQKILRQDEDGNPFHVYFSADTIKKISEKFLAESKHNQTDINHSDDIVEENTLLESWIVEDPKHDKSSLYGFDVEPGSWMVSYKINNKETWSKIKDGTLKGYSVTGSFLEKLIK